MTLFRTSVEKMLFVTLFRTAAERVISGIHKLLRTAEVYTTFTSIVLVVVADGLFGLCGSEQVQVQC